MAKVLSVVHGDNGELIAAAASLWITPTDRVLDMTYGRGLFWTVYQHPAKKFVAHTGNYLNMRYRPTFNVVVFDPPYVSKGGRETSSIDDMDDRYGLDIAPRTIKEANRAIYLGMMKGRDLLVPGGLLFVKCMNYISSGTYQDIACFVSNRAKKLKLEKVDEFILCRPGSGPQPKKNLDGSARRQVHSHRSHSILMVFRKNVG